MQAGKGVSWLIFETYKMELIMQIKDRIIPILLRKSVYNLRYGNAKQLFKMKIKSEVNW